MGYTGPEQPGVLQRMARRLRHRGPDGEGFAALPASAPMVHLGHRRLIVIDPEGGIQPMGSADGAWWITFNGEIYNFAELRSTLEAQGETFLTRSDTEVLLRSLVTWGDEALVRLDGMFAFAAFDARERRLLLAVDRFGQKPLVWSVLRNGRFAFASELTALGELAADAWELDPLAVCRTLAFNHPPAPGTIRRGVQRLEPGCALSVRLESDGRVSSTRLWRYWDPVVETSRERRLPATDDFIQALRVSVRRELVSDVPLGVLLSGGVDSTIVAAVAAGERAITTLSMGFGEAEFDESTQARATAEALDADHRELHLGAEQAVDTLHAVMAHLDEPLADAGCLPTWHLFRTARKVVTVAVGGDGGDEVLEGYPTFAAFDMARRLGPLARLAPWMAPLGSLVPVSDAYYPIGYQVQRFLAGLAARPWHRLQAFMGGLSWAQLRRVVRPEVLDTAGLTGSSMDAEALLFDPAWPQELRQRAAQSGEADQAVFFHLRSYLAGEVLRKVDRMSMAHGLEVRAPMLGSPFAELCLQAESRARRRRGEGKRPLRDWLRRRPDLAPAAGRPKRGFAIPVSRWLRGELRPVAEELFLDPSSPLGDWCHMDAVAQLWRRHLERRADHRKELWALLTLGLWLGHHGRSGA